MQYARSFYIAQWYRDTTVEAEKKMKASGDNEGDFDETEAEMSTEIMENQERRKKFLLGQTDCLQPSDANFRYHYIILKRKFLIYVLTCYSKLRKFDCLKGKF